jgi:transcriptional regulatory protein ASH1
MSLLRNPMYDSDHFRPGHARSRSYSELISQFRTAILSSSPAAKMLTRTSITSATYVKKRSHSDLARDTQSLVPDRSHKRSRTAPPLPPYDFPRSLVTVKAAVTPQPKPQQHVSEPKSVFPSSQKPSSPTPQLPSLVRTLVDSARHTPVKLPSLSSALNSTPMNTIKLNPITPTVSLDYFDTYKPNDENWRFELLDSISKTSKPDYKTTSLLSRFQQNVARARPSFNSKISSKIIHTTELLPQPLMTATPKSSYSEKRINFPYESNYTYLNRTYLNDVERYPEYLELAKSLILLSQLKLTSSPSMAREPAEVDNKFFATNATSTGGDPHVTTLPHIRDIVSPLKLTMTAHRQQAGSPIVAALLHNSIDHQLNYQLQRHYGHQFDYHQPQQRQPHPQPHQHPGTYGYSSFTHTFEVPSTPQSRFRQTPLTPPSSKSKSSVVSRSESMNSPPRSVQPQSIRVCISCGSDQSPCWRPSWSTKEGQLCNSCGLRYKKTAARCLSKLCKKIPAKGEWSLMLSKGKTTFEDGSEGYRCLDCNGRVEVKR